MGQAHREVPILRSVARPNCSAGTTPHAVLPIGLDQAACGPVTGSRHFQYFGAGSAIWAGCGNRFRAVEGITTRAAPTVSDVDEHDDTRLTGRVSTSKVQGAPWARHSRVRKQGWLKLTKKKGPQLCRPTRFRHVAVSLPTRQGYICIDSGVAATIHRGLGHRSGDNSVLPLA